MTTDVQSLGLELRLGLPGGNSAEIKNEKKRVFSEIGEDASRSPNKGKEDQAAGNKELQQVVGWPPVCSYRRKSSSSITNGRELMSKMYVKVSMDGAPFLRKIDMSCHQGYSDLISAIEKLFGCCNGIGQEALKDADNSELVPIYEDKDGDWMLLGDVPWEMFTESCKRLRIKKRSDGGLQTKNLLKGTTLIIQE